jgi:hypothetical protein
MCGPKLDIWYATEVNVIVGKLQLNKEGRES